MSNVVNQLEAVDDIKAQALQVCIIMYLFTLYYHILLAG